MSPIPCNFCLSLRPGSTMELFRLENCKALSSFKGLELLREVMFVFLFDRARSIFPS